jgi:MFS family permease
VLQPSCACLADCLGRKGALAVSVICLATGSLAATLAQNFAVLIFGRTFLGIGIGGVIALSEIIVTDIVPLRFRGQYLAYVSIAWAMGTVAGPVVGGGLAKSSSWVCSIKMFLIVIFADITLQRWIFGMNVPICAVALVMCLLTLSPLMTCRSPLLQRLGRIDWIGFILFTASLVGILVPIMQVSLLEFGL